MASTPPFSPNPSPLFAAIDTGTNSFKLLVVRAHPNGKFFTIDHRTEPIVLDRDTTITTTTPTPFAISAHAQLRALEALRMFKRVLASYGIGPARTRCVATSAVREAVNKGEFSENVREKIGLVVDVLPVVEEARGSVLFASSLNLGHVTLTQKFGDSEEEVSKTREYIRLVIRKSGLVEDINRGGFEVAVGSSGTIQAVEKAVFRGYSNGSNVVDYLAVVSGEGKRDWRLKRGEPRSVVERLCGGGGEEESVVRDRFFKRRSEFIVAGAVLLEEIFEALGIEEMEVSGFALSEGVIAEVLTTGYGVGYDMNANTGWRSVLQLAMRFDGKKRMIAAAQCASIAMEYFEELRKCDEITDNQVAASLDDEDLEYLEAACMLHNIGLFTGKKGFHKQSYLIIMNGDHLYGYSTEEIKLIALLARHHRKKLPKLNHGSFKELPNEVKKKFKFLCAILRISVALCVNIQETESFTFL
ncbi:Ppx/GppA phosphatase [Parasponia andersonii]|uniref:Ppx/GppA phosphatase n=1 Tax=Parasponia andersonii TaxID=3476 RepID=A0A2P5D1A2_PARAD|nr:Ppx/GppA phosphatase [Parasponia andersonii]